MARARLSFLAQFLLAPLRARSVSPAELATGFGGTAQVEFHDKRLQRCCRDCERTQSAIPNS